MKKLERTDAGIDYVRLFADHSKKSGIAEYTERAIAQFGDVLGRSLSDSSQAEHRMRGLRAEALFMAVVAAIGKVSLIKSEDAGDVYYAGADPSVPDFRIVLENGQQLLVEVKVQRLDGSIGSRLKLSDRYVRKLATYAATTKADLRIAIFWEEMRFWTLNRLDAFQPGIPGEKQWSITFSRAMATSEMISLGDYTIATIFPLRFRVLLVPEASDPVPPGTEGSFRVTVKGLRLLSNDRVLTDTSARIAWRLLWYGDWDEYYQQPHHEGDHLLWVDHFFGPRRLDDSDAAATDMEVVASLSGLISTAYLRGAATTIHTTTKDRVLEPGYMRNFIPENFVSLGLDLPLAIFEVEPNFAFEDTEQ